MHHLAHKLFCLCLFVVVITYTCTAHSAYYDTLPRGIKTLVLKKVATSNISSTFSGSGQEVGNLIKIQVDAPTLESVNDIFSTYLQPLNEISPEAYQALNLGEYEIEPIGSVDVVALGFGIGISSRLTAYVAIPYYKAQVDLNFERTKSNNYEEVRSLLNQVNSSENTNNLLVQTITNGLPDLNGQLIQGLVVDYMGYEPIGTWEGSGLGDIELAAKYRLTSWHDAGLATTLGVTLPTGRVDDPDIIQDISFGDGQIDLFGEFGLGFYIPENRLEINSYARYTYQSSSAKEMRIPESSDYLLGLDKTIFEEKLGNKIDYSFAATFLMNDWFKVKSEYLYNWTGNSSYQSNFQEANDILSKDSEKFSHSAKIELGISTVTLYQQQKNVILPFDINISAQKVFSGQNVPSYSRLDAELRLYF